MKKFILLFAVMGLLIAGKAPAQSCQSLTSNIIRGAGKVLSELGKLTEKAARVLSPYILTAATGIPTFSTSATARQAISDFAGDVIQTQMNIFRALGELDGNGGGTIGARHLYVPTQRTTGELLVERTFIIAPSSYHKVTVKIKKLDGRAGANITVCAKWLDGTEYNKLDRKFFVDGEGNIGNEQSWVLNNMDEKWLTIHLVKTGGALNKFDYQVSIEGEYDAAKFPKPETQNGNGGNNNKSANNPQLQLNPDQQINPAILSNQNVRVDTGATTYQPNDVNTGQSSGKRQHGTVRVKNEKPVQDKNATNPASANVKTNNGNIQKVKPTDQVPNQFEVKTARDLGSGRSTGRRQYGSEGTTSTKPAQKNTSTGSTDTTKTQTQRTRKNNIKDPFNPGSPDDDVRNPFDSTKKIKAKQPVTSQAKYDLKNTQVSSIKPANKQKQQTAPVNQANTNKTKVQPQTIPANKTNNSAATNTSRTNTGKTFLGPGERDSFNRKPATTKPARKSKQ